MNMSFPRGAYVNKEEVTGFPKDCEMVPTKPKKAPDAKVDQITPPPPETDSKDKDKPSSDGEPQPSTVISVCR